MRNYQNIEGKYIIHLVKAASETDNLVTILKVNVDVGGGNNKHIHQAFTETFKVNRGEISLINGESQIDLNTGDAFSVNSNVPHHFINKSKESAEFLILITPGSTEFENKIFEGADL